MAVKKILVIFLTVCMLLPLGAGLLSHADETEASSEAAIPEADKNLPDLSLCSCVMLYNIDSGTLMYRYQGDKAVYPASTVKLMVALLAAEMLADRLDEQVTIPKEVINKASTIRMGLKVGESIPVSSLLDALIISGASDAAIALALCCSGSLEMFLAKMNEKAKQLGMTNTAYINVTGVDNYAQQTTGDDLLKLCLAAYENDYIRTAAATPRKVLPPTNLHGARTIDTRNYLLSRWIYPYYIMNDATGLNAGSTEKAGGCVCATASIRNVRYLCIVMGGVSTAGSWNGEPVEKIWRHFTLAKEFFNWGVKYFEYRSVISPMRVYREIGVDLATGCDYVAAIPKETVEIYVRKDVATEDVITLESELSIEHLTAPVEENMEVGRVCVKDTEGNIIGETRLVTKNSLNLSRWKYWEAQIHELVQSKGFVITVVILLIICVAAVLINARIRYVRATRIELRRKNQ